jgi:serine/threonine-protein kinase
VFDASTAMQMAVAHVASVPVPPSERVDQPIPPALERIIMNCLAKRPENRPANAVALLKALDALDLGADGAALVPAQVQEQPVPALFPRPRSRTVLN